MGIQEIFIVGLMLLVPATIFAAGFMVGRWTRRPTSTPHEAMTRNPELSTWPAPQEVSDAPKQADLFY